MHQDKNNTTHREQILFPNNKKPSNQEIQHIISRMKANKALSFDGITNETGLLASNASQTN